MRTLRATLMAMALLALTAFPAFAEENTGDVVISVSCDTNPETVTVTNNLEDLPISVVDIGSLNDPRENEPIFVGVEVAAGESLTFESGTAADQRVLTTEFIFDNDADDEGVVVTIGPEPILQDLTVDCDEGTRSFEVLDDDQQDDQQDEDVPDEMPETGGGGMAGSGLPIGNVAAALSLLTAGGYALVRRS